MKITSTKAADTYRVTDAEGYRLGSIHKDRASRLWIIRNGLGDVAHENTKADAFASARKIL